MELYFVIIVGYHYCVLFLFIILMMKKLIWLDLSFVLLVCCTQEFIGDLKQNLGPLSKQKESNYKCKVLLREFLYYLDGYYMVFYIPIYIVLEYIIVKTSNSMQWF